MIQAAMKINHLVMAIQNMRTNGAEDFVMVSVKEVKINRRSIEACQSNEMWKYDWLYKKPAGLNGHMSIKDSTLKLSSEDSCLYDGRQRPPLFFIKDTVILYMYKVLSIFVVKSQLNRQCHMYMYNSCTDNFH